MAWQSDVVRIIRVLIDDTDYDNYTYTDQRLENTFVVGAYTMIAEIDFQTEYTVNLASNEITPDPSTDIDFIALGSLKAACLILSSEYKIAANCAVTVKDGVSSISYGPVADHLKNIKDDICGKYEELAQDYEYGNSIGLAILGPYAPGSDLISRNSPDLRSGGFFNY